MIPRRRCRLAGVVGVMLVCATSGGFAQWPDRPTPNLPHAADGRPILDAPVPRTPSGRPDLSGVWEPEPDPAGQAGGIEGRVGSRYLIDVTRDAPDRSALLTPAAAAILAERTANALRDNPLIRCQPAGVPRLVAYTHPYKIVQQPDLIVILYEAQTMFRQIYLDGRSLPGPDVQPTWMGYSIGRWDGDVLVVETVGFNDRSWLDGGGRPHSDAMRLVERYRRRDSGHMDVEVQVEDPKTFTQPLRYVQPQRLLPDSDLIEHVCTENVKEIFNPGR